MYDFDAVYVYTHNLEGRALMCGVGETRGGGGGEGRAPRRPDGVKIVVVIVIDCTRCTEPYWTALEALMAWFVYSIERLEEGSRIGTKMLQMSEVRA